LLLIALAGLCLLTGSGATRINLCLFYLGYLIPSVIEILDARSWGQKFEKDGWLWTLGLAIAGLAAAHLLIGNNMVGRLGVLVAGGGGMLLLLVILQASSHPIFYVLDHHLIKFLGTVSYSFYLFNLLSVDLVERIFYFTVGPASDAILLRWTAVFFLSSLLCLALSTCSFYLVERPAIKLGVLFLPPKNDRSRKSSKTGESEQVER
jgi:peptidoglycan/LPS O-acetylase OafA/YrhL